MPVARTRDRAQFSSCRAEGSRAPAPHAALPSLRLRRPSRALMKARTTASNRCTVTVTSTPRQSPRALRVLEPLPLDSPSSRVLYRSERERTHSHQGVRERERERRRERAYNTARARKVREGGSHEGVAREGERVRRYSLKGGNDDDDGGEEKERCFLDVLRCADSRPGEKASPSAAGERGRGGGEGGRSAEEAAVKRSQCPSPLERARPLVCDVLMRREEWRLGIRGQMVGRRGYAGVLRRRSRRIRTRGRRLDHGLRYSFRTG